MGILNTAITDQRWDLAAYILVYAAAKYLHSGGKADAAKKTGNIPRPRTG